MKEEEKTNVKLEDDFKPRKWLVVLLTLIAITISLILATKLITSYNTARKNHTTIIDKLFSGAGDSFNKTSFNNQFELDAGNSFGHEVIDLFDEIIISNKKNKNHIVEVTFGDTTTSDEETIREFKKNVEVWHTYDVVLDYDDNGYINKIEVRK